MDCVVLFKDLNLESFKPIVPFIREITPESGLRTPFDAKIFVWVYEIEYYLFIIINKRSTYQ